jgi:hypothetical protein
VRECDGIRAAAARDHDPVAAPDHAVALDTLLDRG